MPVPLIDPERRLIVTAAPGTGSTSLAAGFAAVPGVRSIPADDVVDAAGRQVLDAKHATVAQVVEAGLLRPDHGHLVITSTRNPFDFYVAEWSRSRTRWVEELRDPTSWVHRQPGALDRLVDALTNDFVAWLEIALEPDLGAGRTRHLNAGHVDEADVVLRMEHLAEDLAGARVDLVVPHLNASRRSEPYWTHYSVEARRWVETVHAPDLDRFGYRF
jgi:hypothetical protein